MTQSIIVNKLKLNNPAYSRKFVILYVSCILVPNFANVWTSINVINMYGMANWTPIN